MSQTLEQRLAAAEDAYDALMTGRSVQELRDANGETIRYTPASAPRLRAYIEDLRRQLNNSTTGPMGFYL